MQMFTKCRRKCEINESLSILASYDVSTGKYLRTFRGEQNLHLEGHAVLINGADSLGSKLFTEFASFVKWVYSYSVDSRHIPLTQYNTVPRLLHELNISMLYCKAGCCNSTLCAEA
jgi:hypothetical protein